MLLCNLTLEQWQIISDIVANIFSVVASIGIIYGAYSFWKNRLNRNTFTLSVENIQKTFEAKVIVHLSFSNFTDKQFTIIETNLILDDKEFPMKFRKKGVYDLFDYFPLKNIQIDSHESKDIEAIFDIPIKELPPILLFNVKTTQKTFSYKIHVKKLLSR